MPGKTAYTLHAEIFKALAHPLRIEVTDILQEEELCFSQILEKTGGIKSNLSQHLTILVSSGILRMRRDSRCNYYSLSSGKVVKACRLLREVIAENLKRQNKILALQ